MIFTSLSVCRVNDQILFVNNSNMNRASHNDAVQALRDAGMQARMVGQHV